MNEMAKRNKKDVDRYVSQIPEKEKNSRGYQISLLYYEAADYETAKRYLAAYISCRENIPQAHKLMGNILEALKYKEQAIASYRRSLELDSKQKDLILKICELYSTMKNIDPERLKYWVEQAERAHPSNPIVFKLKEQIMSGSKFEDMEDFYTKQLVKNYTDVNLHIKLLDLYMTEDKVGTAYRHTVDVEKTQDFSDNLVWYENVTRVFPEYLKRERCYTDTSFYTHRMIVLCNLVYLQVKEKEIVTCAQSLYMLDQTLQEAMMIKSQKPEWTAILSEVQGMYYFLCGLLLLKRANKGQLVWKDASSFSLVCFLLSYSYPIINKTSPWYIQAKAVQLQEFYDHVQLFGSYRLSQAGYIITSLLKSEVGSQLNVQIQQLRTSQARDKLYDIMFTMREMREKKGKSYLMKSDGYCTAQVSIPSKKLVADNDQGVQELFCDNLHQLVWLALQKYSMKDQVHPDYGLSSYKFPLNSPDIDSSSLESLSQLDVQAFFMATVRCSSISYEEQRKLNRKDQFKPYLLPACLCSSLSTSAQDDWWMSMFKFHAGKGKENFSKLRATVQRGLDVIRLHGSHGLSIVAITNIAKSLDQRAKECEKLHTEESREKMTAYSIRAEMYWKEALNIVDKLERRVSQRLPKERLFDDKDYGLIDSNQIQETKDKATFSMATVAMRSGDVEKAKTMFESVKTPWASFYLAKIYRDMSENSDDTGLASERLTLMERAYDTLYLTLDRLKSHKNQELEKNVMTEIDEIANELEGLRNAGTSLVDSICQGMNGMTSPSVIYNQTEEDTGSEEEYTSFNTPQGKEQPVIKQPPMASPSFVASTPAVKFKTPTKSPAKTPVRVSMEVSQRERPSPERLEARIWALEKKQETVIELVQDMKNDHSELKKAVKGMKDEYGDLMKQMRELVLSQRMQPMMPPPPTQMYPSPAYPGSIYRPPNPYQYQPQSPMMPTGYGYPMSASPGPATRPIPSRISRGAYMPSTDPDEDYCGGDFYEDEGQGMFGQDTSGWTVNHRPGMEGFPGQPQTIPPGMPQAGFFASAVRGQALQFQGQGSSLMTPGLLSMSQQPGRESIPSTGVVPQHPGVIPSNRGQSLVQPGSQATVNTQSQLAELLATDSRQEIQPVSKATVSQKQEVQTSYGVSPGLQTFGTTSTPSSMPYLSSLMAASTSPEKSTPSLPKATPPKSTFTFGQTSTGTSSPSQFKFGQTTGVPGTNLFTSPIKATQPGSITGTNLFTGPVNVGKPGSKETSPVKSPSKTGEDHVEEYEPNVDFKPVIDLPDIVETKTGEEEEEVLFCERAKLFRFDDKQWKEKGVGDLKFLRHKQSKRVRILMRREQVLKVCANHYLSKEMKLSPMSAQKKAWCWTAQDFSEGEQVVENFAVRFKDEDVASRFKATFEKLIAELEQAKIETPKTKPPQAVTSDKPSLKALFKTVEGSWTCDVCVVSNKPDVQRCVACRTLKPGLKPEDVKPETKPSIFSSKPATGGFSFGGTTSDQKTSTGSGFSFKSTTGGTSAEGVKFGQSAGVVKPDSTKTESGIQFGAKPSTSPAKPDSTTTTGGFRFGQLTALKTTEADSSKAPLSGGFKFGQMPEVAKEKSGPSQFTFTPQVSSTTDNKKQEAPKEQGKTTPAGISFQTGKTSATSGFSFQPSGFTFGGTKPSTDSSNTVSFKPSAISTAAATTTTTTKPSVTTSVPSTSSAAKKDEKKGFGNLFKPKEGSWKCNQCLINNDPEKLKCSACATLKPGVTKEQAKAQDVPTTKKEEKKGFGTMFQQQVGNWTCEGCYLDNPGDKLQCPACNTFKPGVKKEDLPKETEKPAAFGGTSFSFGGTKPGFAFGSQGKSEAEPSTTASKPAAGGFTFGASQVKTTVSDTSKPSPETKSGLSGFSFTPTKTDSEKKSDTPSSGFSFTLKPSTKSASPETTSKGFSFNPKPSSTTPEKSSGFNFTMSPPKLTPKSPGDAEGMYVNKEGEDDHIYFEPVIELPSVVEVVTGEEDEEVLFVHRAKLFRFIDGDWKERGLGDIKISKNKETGKVRLLMRREQILKICLNHYLTKDLELKPMPKANGKAWVWFAMDFSDEEPETRQFAIKFKNQEVADNFKQAFDNAKDQEGTSPQTSPVKEKVDSPTKDYSNDVEVVKEEKATEEQIKMARKYQLPDHFYLYENKPDCPGCIGCENYQPGMKCSPPKAKGNTKVAADSTSNATFGKPQPSLGAATSSSVFGSGSPQGTFSFASLAKDSSGSGSVFGGGAKPDSSTGLFGGATKTESSPGLFRGATKTESSSGLFGGPKNESSGLFGGAKTESSGLFGGAKAESSGIFGGGGVSFSDIAKQSEGSPSGFKVQDHNKQFSWSGTGQQLFSGGGGDGNEENEDDDGGATYDPHYEPIIDLPDLVDVKTGEEDYDKIFCQRAKLYRFDKDANAWKEKGLGEMKILKHKENKRYRLILRREQVFKIACNQWLTPELSFKPMQTSETAWCWVGHDFSENEPVIEQMSVKFKTVDLANEFMDAIKRCQEDLKQQQKMAMAQGDSNNHIPITVTSDPQSNEVSSSVSPGGNVEGDNKEEEEYEDDDEDYSTEEEDIIFDKRIKFFSKEGGNWKAVGLGALRVVFDEDVNGYRIMVELDNKEIVCNHLVAKESNFALTKKECQWSPMDFSTDEPVRRYFMAQFSSEQAAKEFHNYAQEGITLAKESDISERNMVTFPREITFGHQAESSQ